MQKFITEEQLNAMKIASLRDLCKTEGVLISGNRSVLMDRLCALPAPAHHQPVLDSSVGAKRRKTEQRSQSLQPPHPNPHNIRLNYNDMLYFLL
jgi:hypothetical protein